MSAKSTKDLQVYITKGDTVPLALIPTAITSAKPAVVTVTNVLNDGDIVFARLTGFSELDGKMWVVASATGTEFTLLGSDTSDSAGTLDPAPLLEAYDQDTDMVLLCLSSLVLNVDEPGTISVATFCDPSASIPSAVLQAGTISFGGFVNILDADYNELLIAADDNVARGMKVVLPENGYLVAPMTFSQLTWDLPLDGAVGYTGTAVLSTKMVHQF